MLEGVKMFKSFLHCLLSVLLVFQFYSIDATAKSESSLTNPLDQLILNLEQKPETKGIRAGVSVYDLTKGEYLYRYQENKSFVPASVFKLLVSAAALDAFGMDYRYRTEVYALGPVHQGTLEGDILIKGYGDPSLTEQDLQAITQQLIGDKGIKEIHGNILVDESYFDSVRLGRGWTWDDERWYYSAPISALSVQENSVKVTVTHGSKQPKVQIEPKTDYVQLENKAQMMQGTENKLQFDRPIRTNKIKVFGSLGRKAAPVEEELSIDNPPLYVGELWKKQLILQGIRFSPTTHIVNSKTVTTVGPLMTHYSKPLSELVRHLNKDSDNFYAEMFLKTLGAVKKREGSFQAGIEVVKTFVKFAEGYHQADGSGLSRYDQITPDQMVTLLRQIQDKPYRDAFEQSLPLAGVDGTMEKRLAGTPAAANLHAKTGSMSGISSLAGYVTAANGDKLAFSMMMNGVYKLKDARSFQDQATLLLTSYPNLPTVEEKAVSKPAYPLASVLDPILDQGRLKETTAGVIVKSLDQNKWLYARNEDKLFTPGPAAKLMLTRAALQTMGPGYKFKTEIYWDKKNLYIKGYGDPSIRSADLDTLVAQIKEIKNIPGDIILDESFFNDTRYPWGWSGDEEEQSDHPQTSAISLEDGVLQVEYGPGQLLGTPMDFSITPSNQSIHLENKTHTVLIPSTKGIQFIKERGTNHITATGIISWLGSQLTERLAVEDPAAYLGEVLKEKLKAAGVDHQGLIRKGAVPAGIPKIAQWESKSLNQLLAYMIQTDNNLYAEMITKALGTFNSEAKQKGGTVAGTEMITKSFGPGPESWFDLYDGSGVSHYNQVAPAQLLAGHYDYLPDREPGVKGLSGVSEGRSSFCGVVTNEKGERFLVILLLNGYSGADSDVQRQMIDLLKKVS
jgi:serine-type D-Ala-D-Ala carboxypeptidase/endopeptidase (penicillin-binding protein 4)